MTARTSIRAPACPARTDSTGQAMNPEYPGPVSEDDRIPLCVPEFSGLEREYVEECIRSGWISTSGPLVDSFEQRFADTIGVRHAVATNCGTSALHTALLVAGVREGDEVLVSDLTFIAPANAIRYAGAHPVFVDVEPLHAQIDAEQVVSFLRNQCRWRAGRLENRKTGRTIGGVLVVHLLGHPVDMNPILDVTRAFNLPVIEDASQGLGARYRERNVGQWGRVACFSFNGNKTITTGAGGMLVTEDSELADRARYLTTQAKDDPVDSIHGCVGYNYRLSAVHAAIGLAQLESLADLVSKKRSIAARYREAWTDIEGLTCPEEAGWAYGSHWMNLVILDLEQTGIDRRELQASLREEGIETRPLWQPLHRSPAHQSLCAYPCARSETLHKQGLCLPSSTGLSAGQQERTIHAIRNALDGNG